MEMRVIFCMISRSTSKKENAHTIKKGASLFRKQTTVCFFISRRDDNSVGCRQRFKICHGHFEQVLVCRDRPYRWKAGGQHGETVGQISHRFSHWFCQTNRKYGSHHCIKNNPWIIAHCLHVLNHMNCRLDAHPCRIGLILWRVFVILSCCSCQMILPIIDEKK